MSDDLQQTEDITELVKALDVFHQEVDKVQKTAVNPFFKSKYATLPNILDAIKDPLHKAGLTFSQFPVGNNGLTTLLAHSSGQHLKATYYMVPAKTDPQGIGSAITYQRRYALAAVLGLNIDDDDDGNAASVPPETAPQGQPQKKQVGPITEKQRGLLFARTSERGMADNDAKALIGRFGYKSSKEIQWGDFDKILRAIDDWKPGVEADAPPSDTEVPLIVREAWSKMTSIKASCELFGSVKDQLSKLLGDDLAYMTYYKVLDNHGVEHANGFTRLDKARQCMRELLCVLEGARKEQANAS